MKTFTTIATLVVISTPCNGIAIGTRLRQRWGQKRATVVQTDSSTKYPQETDNTGRRAFHLGSIPSADVTEHLDRHHQRKAALDVMATYGHDMLVDLSSPKEIDDFLIPDHLNHIGLLLNGGSIPIEKVDATPELLQKWCQRAKQFGWDYVNEHEMYRVRNDVSLLPGLQLQSECIMGCRRTTTNNEESVVEFTLIDDHVTAKGSKFLVWIYDQCSGEPKKAVFPNTDPKRRRHTFTHMRVAVVQETVSVSTCIRSQCRIPRSVIKFLPNNVQALVSQSMATALQREMTHSAEQFASAFSKWKEAQDLK